jgi:type IV pilus assembly protein PilC
MEYVCRLGTPEGRVVEERHDAVDESSLRRELEHRGFHVFEIRRRGLDLARLPGLRGRRRRVAPRRFLIFNQELAALLRSGLPLLQALDLMLERMEDDAFRPLLGEIRDRVKSGADLSDAFAAYGDVFPRLYAPTLKAGERSGELEAVVRRFIRYQRLMLDARRRAVSALVYPAVLIGLSIAMILVLTFFVVPKFSAFFQGMDDLPLVTRIVLGVAGFTSKTAVLVPNWVWLVAGLVAGVLALRSWARTARGAEALDRAKLRVPIVGEVLHRFSLSEFCRALGTLITGGMPLVPALEIATGAVANASIRAALAPRIQMVREGKPFHAMLDASEVFPAMAIDMVKVGEATGSLDEMLGNVSDLFDEQAETRLQRLLTLVEPVMLVFMGLIIGLLLVSIYLPLFRALGTVS